jgi:hypothetical protein
MTRSWVGCGRPPLSIRPYGAEYVKRFTVIRPRLALAGLIAVGRRKGFIYHSSQ